MGTPVSTTLPGQTKFEEMLLAGRWLEARELPYARCCFPSLSHPSRLVQIGAQACLLDKGSWPQRPFSQRMRFYGQPLFLPSDLRTEWLTRQGGEWVHAPDTDFDLAVIGALPLQAIPEDPDRLVPESHLYAEWHREQQGDLPWERPGTSEAGLLTDLLEASAPATQELARQLGQNPGSWDRRQLTAMIYALFQRPAFYQAHKDTMRQWLWQNASPWFRYFAFMHGNFGHERRHLNGRRFLREMAALPDVDPALLVDIAGTDARLVALDLGQLPADLIYSLGDFSSLYLRHLHLPKFPPQVPVGFPFTKISADGNRISALPASFTQFTKLIYLDLNRNAFREFPSELVALPKLEVLQLNHNQIQHLPDRLDGMQKLRFLFLKRNQLEVLPASLGLLRRLERLDLEHNQLRELPASIRHLHRLSELKLGDNALRTLPYELRELPQLRSLSFEDNPFEQIPEVLGELERVGSYYFSGHPLKEIRADFRKAKELRILRFGPLAGGSKEPMHLQLKLPPQVSSLAFQGLRLQAMAWEQLADSSLQSLNLSQTGLGILPAAWPHLPNFYSLSLDDNGLDRLPEDWSGMRQVHFLNVHEPGVRALPEGLHALQELRHLQLGLIPDRWEPIGDLIDALPHLTYLHLSLPEEFHAAIRARFQDRFGQHLLLTSPRFPSKI